MVPSDDNLPRALLEVIQQISLARVEQVFRALCVRQVRFAFARWSLAGQIDDWAHRRALVLQQMGAGQAKLNRDQQDETADLRERWRANREDLIERIGRRSDSGVKVPAEALPQLLDLDNRFRRELEDLQRGQVDNVSHFEESCRRVQRECDAMLQALSLVTTGGQRQQPLKEWITWPDPKDLDLYRLQWSFTDSPPPPLALNFQHGLELQYQRGDLTRLLLCVLERTEHLPLWAMEAVEPPKEKNNATRRLGAQLLKSALRRFQERLKHMAFFKMSKLKPDAVDWSPGAGIAGSKVRRPSPYSETSTPSVVPPFSDENVRRFTHTGRSPTPSTILEPSSTMEASDFGGSPLWRERMFTAHSSEGARAAAIRDAAMGLGGSGGVSQAADLRRRSTFVLGGCLRPPEPDGGRDADGVTLQRNTTANAALGQLRGRASRASVLSRSPPSRLESLSPEAKRASVAFAQTQEARAHSVSEPSLGSQATSPDASPRMAVTVDVGRPGAVADPASVASSPPVSSRNGSAYVGADGFDSTGHFGGVAALSPWQSPDAAAPRVSVPAAAAKVGTLRSAELSAAHDPLPSPTSVRAPSERRSRSGSPRSGGDSSIRTGGSASDSASDSPRAQAETTRGVVASLAPAPEVQRASSSDGSDSDESSVGPVHGTTRPSTVQGGAPRDSVIRSLDSSSGSGSSSASST